MSKSRHALVAGVEGREPSEDSVAAATDVARALRQLAAEHRIHDTRLRASVEGGAILDALGEWRRAVDAEAVWLVLVGDLTFDAEVEERSFRTEETQGLDVEKLATRFRLVRCPCRVLVLDVPEAHMEALGALDWGPCAVRAIGPGVARRLVAALQPEAAGAVTAGAVAAMLDGHSDAPDMVLDRRVVASPRAVQRGPEVIAYLRWLRTDAEKLLLDPVARDGGARLTLDDVYEPVQTRGGATAHQCFAVHRCIFIVGDPGSGKTTFVKRLTAGLCTAALGEGKPVSDAAADSLPVRLDLADVSGPVSPHTLLEAALAGLYCEGSDRVLDRALVSHALVDGRLVLLFDGLDEVADSTRRKNIAEAIAVLADGPAKRARIVVTCRPAAAQDGATPPAPFQRFDLVPFTDAQIEAVATRWMRARPETRDAAEAIGAHLRADLQSHAAVHQLAANPLTLTLVCAVLYRRPQARLPKDRTELYDLLVAQLLDNRQRGREPPPLQEFERRRYLTDLAVAWWEAAVSRGDQATFDQATLDEGACCDLLVSKRSLPPETAQRLVRFFDERAGLLVWRGKERGHRALRFAHRSFAEYLKACRLTEEAGQTELRNMALEPAWREVALMYVGELARKVTGDPKPAWSFVEDLLGYAETACSPWAQRGAYARLAAECLADWRDRAPDPLVRRLDAFQEAFVDVEEAAAIPAEERVRFWMAVGPHNRLVVEPRFSRRVAAAARGQSGDEAPAAQGDDRWAWVPAGTFWRGTAPEDELAHSSERPAGPVSMSAFFIGRWPVTVEAFAEFHGEGGYDDRAHWSEAGWAWRTGERVAAPRTWPLPGHHLQPITGVSFWEAEAYCAWLSATGQAPRPGWTVRLPTEAQWERAVRGEHVEGAPIARYPWGWDDAVEHRAGAGSWRGTTPPGAFPGGVGPFGTWDQSGNVWEWCLDERLPYEERPRRDPFHAPRSPSAARVCRGGAFDYVPQGLRVSYRFDVHPYVRFGSIGFRCVAVPPQDP